jgi:hypothetical protein
MSSASVVMGTGAASSALWPVFGLRRTCDLLRAGLIDTGIDGNLILTYAPV